MLSERLNSVIDKADTEPLRRALRYLLRQHAEPVFGAAKTSAHEVAALNALKALKYINPTEDEFDLVEELDLVKLMDSRSLWVLVVQAFKFNWCDPVSLPER